MNKDKILPPVILAVIIFFLLQIVFDVPFIFVFAIIVVVIIIVIVMQIRNSIAISSRILPTSLTSKLSNTPSIKTVVYGLLALIVILTIVISLGYLIFGFIDYRDVRIAEDFGNNQTSRGYGFSRENGGDFVIEYEKLMVLKTTEITSTGIKYRYPDFSFSIGGVETGETITVKVVLESENGYAPFEFTVKGLSIDEKRVKFGVDESDQIWVKVDNAPIDIGDYLFDTSGSYDVNVDITSDKIDDPKGPLFYASFSVDNIILG